MPDDKQVLRRFAPQDDRFSFPTDMQIADVKGRYSVLGSTLTRLQELSFPPLNRPEGDVESPATPELIDWGTRVFAFSQLSHFRELLRSFLFLAENGHVMASFLICRSMYEIGALAYYVNKHLGQHMKRNDLDKTWALLLDVQIGSRYMQEFGGDPNSEISPHVRKTINCLNEYLGGERAAETYSFLSEHAHPGIFTSARHYEINLASRRVVFGEPPRDRSEAPLDNAITSTITVLHFLTSLLLRTEETEVSHQLEGWLQEFVQLHKDDKV